MKKIRAIILISTLFVGCFPEVDAQETGNTPILEFVPKFKEGELVYVNDYAFIVWSERSENYRLYSLKIIDCKSDNCFYGVLESEITKTKNGETSVQ